MPNPYDDILGEDDSQEPTGPERTPAPNPDAVPRGFTPTVDLNDPRFLREGPEPLDEILADIDAFQQRAVDFSRLLSDLAVPDHKVDNRVLRMFLVMDDPHDRGDLAGERQYHTLQTRKFHAIIEPMRELAVLHLETVKHFNRDIDKQYYSVEKTDREVQSDITRAINGINLQRRILAEASSSLDILRNGLVDTERRIKNYVNAGGRNNISRAEYELVVRDREELTSGRQHRLDYAFFDVNLLDKTALALGVYLKETSAQYLKKLGEAVVG